MSSYESAPATKMIATRCCVCRRSLVDAKSTELGIGPDCREAHGFDVEIPEMARQAANAAVYQLAILRGMTRPASEMLPLIEQIRKLGLVKLAAILEDRLSDVKITIDSGLLIVSVPFKPTFADELRKRVPTGARRWVNAKKCWVIHPGCKPGLWEALQVSYSGRLAVGPKGAFIIGSAK